jgi:hypothetical protein
MLQAKKFFFAAKMKMKKKMATALRFEIEKGQVRCQDNFS